MAKLSNEEKFNQLKDRYVSNFKRTANRDMTVVYENGFVILKAEGQLGTSKVRVSEFEKMTLGLESRKDYEAPKPRVVKVFEGDINKENTDVEDGGQAIITHITEPTNTDNGMFIRIQSWDEQLKHEEFKKFEGRKIRITIETID